MAFETRSGMPYNPYFDDPYFQLPFPPAAYRKGLADFADMKASDADRLRKAMLPNVPSSLDYFDDDPARMIQNQFQQYRDQEPVAPPTRPQSVRPPSPEVQSRQMAGPPQQAQGPANPPRDTSPFNYNVPVAPKTSAVQTTGLLDTEDAPESGSSWYDDPMRMGLLQAGLGLMSAPRYSTNPNDVTLGSALARGLGGFVQGYGGTKQRLSEAERQKLEDEYRKSERDFNKMYKEVMMDDAKSRIDERRGNYSATVREKLEEKNLIDTMVNEVLAAEGKIDNKTRKINLTTLARQDRDRFNELHQNATTDRAPFEQILIESGRFTKEQAEAQPLSLLMQNAETISGQQANPPKPETKELGEADERMFDSLNKGKRGDIPLGDPEYVNAYTRYYEKYLRPKTYPDGSSYLPSSQFDAPPDFKTAAVMGQGDLVSQVNTPGGSLIKRMDQKDKDAVRNLTSNISQLEEYENILSKIDINNLDRISQTSPEIADLQTLFKNLQLRLKDNPYGLGALTGPDMGLMEAILSDPTKADIMDWRAYLQNRPFYLAQANRLKKILVQDADSIYSDYSTSLADEFQRKHNRPLNWLEQEPTAEFRLSTRSEDILAEEEPAVPPMTNNGNESSFFDPLINILPDAIQNLGR
jgi:hypothetical protein